MILGYHPALDPYHTARRILRLLRATGGSGHPHTLRILDFFLLFPEDIPSIQLPREHGAWRSKFRHLANQYWFTGDRALVFERMAPVHEAAFALLVAAGWVKYLEEPGSILELVSPPERLLETDPDGEAEGDQALEFVTSVLASLDLMGPDGLKKRTGLMEYRYDATT